MKGVSPMTVQTLVAPDATATTPRNGHVAQRVWRYEDYLQLPDDGKRYEIIEAVLYVANAPTIEHQYAVNRISFYLQLATIERDLGIVLIAPLEVHLSESTRPVQPDVLFIRKDRQSILTPQLCAGAPDLIVEVISPSSLRLDRQVKYRTYEAHGVTEYWLVDPKVRGVEIYVLADGEYALLGQYTEDDVIESTVVPGLQIVAKTLFQAPTPTPTQA